MMTNKGWVKMQRCKDAHATTSSLGATPGIKVIRERWDRHLRNSSELPVPETEIKQVLATQFWKALLLNFTL